MIDRAAAMLKYSVWIADPAFTCMVFDLLEPCFVLASDKGIICKFCSLQDLGAAASVKLYQQQDKVMSAFPT